MGVSPKKDPIWAISIDYHLEFLLWTLIELKHKKGLPERWGRLGILGET